jgi:hypothetical protein
MAAVLERKTRTVEIRRKRCADHGTTMIDRRAWRQRGPGVHERGDDALGASTRAPVLVFFAALPTSSSGTSSSPSSS